MGDAEKESESCCDGLVSWCFPEPEVEVDFRHIETRTGPRWMPSRSSTGGGLAGSAGEGIEADFASGFADNSIHTAKYVAPKTNNLRL